MIKPEWVPSGYKEPTDNKSIVKARPVTNSLYGRNGKTSKIGLARKQTK